MTFPHTIKSIPLHAETAILSRLQQALGYDLWRTAATWYHQDSQGFYRTLDLTLNFRSEADRVLAITLLADPA
jgi:hypothetical protein